MITAKLQKTQELQRIEYLKDLIQRNHDSDNWYGRDYGFEKKSILTLAAKVELINLGVTDFKPVYNCPA